jgi:hypothetical protein
VREEKGGELRFRELDGDRRRYRLVCHGTHQARAACEAW